MTAKTGKTVHALLQGRPMCGFSIDVPVSWPEGHIWTDIADLANINCTTCKQKAVALGKKTAMANEKRDLPKV